MVQAPGESTYDTAGLPARDSYRHVERAGRGCFPTFTLSFFRVEVWFARPALPVPRIPLPLVSPNR